MDKQIYVLTQEGYDKLVTELDIFQKEKRPKAVARLKSAREMGDLSENSEYGAAKEELGYVDGRIMEIEETLKNSQIVTHNANNAVVSIGDTVTVSINNEKKIFTLVGELEADISNGKLSHKSPIGIALMKKAKGDTVKVTIPAGVVEYKILDIT